VNLPLLICSDLDRTLLPNGHHPESPGARDSFARLVSRDEVELVYVSGRDLQRVLDAMDEYHLPTPRFIIGDVGTTLYEQAATGWTLSESWQETILNDWRERRPAEIIAALDPIEGISLQDRSRQGAAKISFYIDTNSDRSELKSNIAKRLESLKMSYRLVLSADETVKRGLLDILPASASKLHAIEFLIDNWPYLRERTLFAGDSGNDMEVLTSSLPSVLVANAGEEVRSLAAEEVARQGHDDALYMAEGGFPGNNGNYAAGILEGVAHYFPETLQWMKEQPSNE
jgi:HAD superfamily hydrolase (TIGR01484 family)